mmetsp:Transcript_9728/g.31655  ORF Transcript_9728/g.31655 Transcript_9728/m.31655 type:complete len:309 (+) Transcript_9728:302-1228(+)
MSVGASVTNPPASRPPSPSSPRPATAATSSGVQRKAHGPPAAPVATAAWHGRRRTRVTRVAPSNREAERRRWKRHSPWEIMRWKLSSSCRTSSSPPPSTPSLYSAPISPWSSSSISSRKWGATSAALLRHRRRVRGTPRHAACGSAGSFPASTPSLRARRSARCSTRACLSMSIWRKGSHKGSFSGCAALARADSICTPKGTGLKRTGTSEVSMGPARSRRSLSFSAWRLRRLPTRETAVSRSASVSRSPKAVWSIMASCNLARAPPPLLAFVLFLLGGFIVSSWRRRTSPSVLPSGMIMVPIVASLA